MDEIIVLRSDNVDHMFTSLDAAGRWLAHEAGIYNTCLRQTTGFRRFELCEICESGKTESLVEFGHQGTQISEGHGYAAFARCWAELLGFELWRRAKSGSDTVVRVPLATVAEYMTNEVEYIRRFGY